MTPYQDLALENSQLGEPDQRDRGRQKEAGPGTRSSQKDSDQEQTLMERVSGELETQKKVREEQAKALETIRLEAA